MPVEIIYRIDNTNVDEKVKFLAFEGGGGKGIAFLGALAALEEIGILGETPQIEGISGSCNGRVCTWAGTRSVQIGSERYDQVFSCFARREIQFSGSEAALRIREFHEQLIDNDPMKQEKSYADWFALLPGRSGEFLNPAFAEGYARFIESGI